jgi:putative peptidoglycan lipid II flippase
VNRSVAWLTVASFVAMGAGFLREVVVAYQFGTTATADAFSLTLFYVDGLMAVVLTGLSGYMLVPVVTRLVHKEGPDAGFRLLETCLLWATLLAIPGVALGWIAPKSLAQAIAPEFSVEQRVPLVALIGFAVTSCALILGGGAMVGVLQARASYAPPVYARAAFSLVTAVALVIGVGGLGIRAGGLGLCLGALLQLLLLALALGRLGWRPRMPRAWHPALPRALAAGLPTVLALLLTNVFMGGAQRYLASSLPEGAFAAVNYAQRAVNLVSSLTMALATVSLTELSLQFSAGGADRRTVQVLRDSLESGIFLLVPLSGLLLISSEPIVALLFKRGRYDLESLALTASCLRWLALSIVPGLVVAILHRACPAFGRPWRATLVSVVWAIATVVATAPLLSTMGAPALTAGFTAGMMVAAICSVIAVRDLVGRGLFAGVARYIAQMTLVAAAAAVPAVIGGRALPLRAAGWTTLSSAGTVLLEAVLFGVAFGLGCVLLREPRWRALSLATVRVLGDARRMLAGAGR